MPISCEMKKRIMNPIYYQSTYLSAVSQSVIQYENKNGWPGRTFCTNSCKEEIRQWYQCWLRCDTTLMDSKWNCLCVSLIPSRVTGNLFSLHLKVESMWKTHGNKELNTDDITDNNALDDMLRMKGNSSRQSVLTCYYQQLIDERKWLVSSFLPGKNR